MANKFLSYISDEHFLKCIENLHNSYIKAKNDIQKKKFYNNKIDTIKLTFDSKFNELTEENLIKSEIARQIDKSINNAIGTFHEEILGGIKGFEKGSLDGYDIKANDNTLFADIKNKHNTMNSSAGESLYQKLEKFAAKFPSSKCYWVQIWSTKSFNELWGNSINGTAYSNERVYKISGDQFYYLLSGEKEALYNLYKTLPIAIDFYLKNRKESKAEIKGSAFEEIVISSKKSKRKIIDEITAENFGYYFGFDKL